MDPRTFIWMMAPSPGMLLFHPLMLWGNHHFLQYQIIIGIRLEWPPPACICFVIEKKLSGFRHPFSIVGTFQKEKLHPAWSPILSLTSSNRLLSETPIQTIQ